jgi:hypothetical protein
MLLRTLFVSLAVLLAGSGIATSQQSTAETGCPNCQPKIAGWRQSGRLQPITYGTPLRNFFFGRTRFVPVGPPQPYAIVPGRVVFPELVYPREVQPQIVWPTVPAPAGGPQP